MSYINIDEASWLWKFDEMLKNLYDKWNISPCYQYNAVLSLNSWESGYAKDKLMQKIGIA